MKRPRIWDDNEDIVLFERRWVNHKIVAEEASYFSSTGNVGVSLESSIFLFYHPFAKNCPRFCVDGKDKKDLEWMEAFARRVGGGTGRDEAGELNKSATLSLRVIYG